MNPSNDFNHQITILRHEILALEHELSIKQNELNEQISIAKYVELESNYFPGWRKITTNELNSLTDDQLDFLVYKRSGEYNRINSHYVESVEDEKYIIHKLPKEMRTDYIRYLNTRNCYYCHRVSHSKAECRVLKSTRCQNCKTYGHTTGRCHKSKPY